MIWLLVGTALICVSCASITSEVLPSQAVDNSAEAAASDSLDELGFGQTSASADKAQSRQSRESGFEQHDQAVAKASSGDGNPPVIFGRKITADELVDMLGEESGWAHVVDAMVSSTTLNDEQAGCMISSLSYETFVTVANGERPTNTQAGELMSAFEVCGIE